LPFRAGAALVAAVVMALSVPGGTVDSARLPPGTLGAPFAVGEKTAYAVRWGPLPGGVSVQTIESLGPVRGRAAYHIVSQSRSNRAVDRIHKIRERNESWMDAEDFSSLRFVEDVRNGSYRKKSETDVDPESRHMTHTYRTRKHSGDTNTTAPEGLQDLVSLVYHLRTRPLLVGDEYAIPLQTGGKVQNLKVLVKGVEEVKVPAGTFSCFHIVPELEDEKDSEQVKLEIWLTDDARRVPVLIKSDLTVGSFVAEMTSHTPGNAL
jgi:hypothetical protein